MEDQQVYDKLKRKFPGFLQDKDEGWIIYLGSRERHFLRSRRVKFFLLENDLDKCTNFSERTKIERERLQLAREVLDKIDGFKKEALERINEDVYSQINYKCNSGKQEHKPQQASQTIALPELEELDEFVPRYSPPPPTCATSPLNEQQETGKTDNRASTNFSRSSKFASNIPKSEPNVMPGGTDCRNEIDNMMQEYYNCRDGVIKCLNSMKTRNPAIHSLDTILSFIESNKS